MKDIKNKEFTAQAKASIKGEAFFESLVSDYSIPHHIVGLKDVGIDYICEWVYGDRPTGILYAVQVKTFSQPNFSKKYVKANGLDSRNQLDKYRIKHNLLNIRVTTQEYWRGLGIPIYLFVIVCSKTQGHYNTFDCYYKRFTSILTANNKQDGEYFYRVNKGTTFLAFADQQDRKGGFARDLFVDLIRCYYSKGLIFYISPQKIGLEQFPEQNAVFKGVINEYRESICNTYKKTKSLLETMCKNHVEDSSGDVEVVPSEEVPSK